LRDHTFTIVERCDRFVLLRNGQEDAFCVLASARAYPSAVAQMAPELLAGWNWMDCCSPPCAGRGWLSRRGAAEWQM